MQNRTTLEYMVSNGEVIMWRGRPDTKVMVMEAIFNPMLPIALIWGIIDFGIIGAGFGGFMGDFGGMGSFAFLLIPFFLLHLMPVWIYLGGVIFASLRAKNTEYLVTDKAVYISGGILTYKTEMKPLAELSHITIHQGLFDRGFGVGDVILTCNHGTTSHSQHGSHYEEHSMTIADIPDFAEVFKMIKELQTDVYSDTMYPNDMRPEANHGYNTTYEGSANRFRQ